MAEPGEGPGAGEPTTPPDDHTRTAPGESHSRAQLAWDLIVFQFKLAADGLRDVVLVPISLVAGLLGLLFGGSDPAQYFRQVLKFGRRTEYWINLFGHRHRGGTADDIIKPIQNRVFEEAGSRPWVQKAGSQIDRTLDNVGEALSRKAAKQTRKPDAADE